AEPGHRGQACSLPGFGSRPPRPRRQTMAAGSAGEARRSCSGRPPRSAAIAAAFVREGLPGPAVEVDHERLQAPVLPSQILDLTVEVCHRLAEVPIPFVGLSLPPDPYEDPATMTRHQQ